MVVVGIAVEDSRCSSVGSLKPSPRAQVVIVVSLVEREGIVVFESHDQEVIFRLGRLRILGL
jgi:hypothetical protein